VTSCLTLRIVHVCFKQPGTRHLSLWTFWRRTRVSRPALK
jgi:hypothetical protein